MYVQSSCKAALSCHRCNLKLLQHQLNGLERCKDYGRVNKCELCFQMLLSGCVGKEAVGFGDEHVKHGV